MNSHGVVRESMCAICGKRFSRPNHLKAHEKIHIDGEQVDSVVLNINNESDVVAPPRKLFTCKLCGQQFESGSGLKLHLKKNHPNASTKCDYCTKTFSTRGQRDHVKIHQQIHSDQVETEELHTIEIVDEAEEMVVVDDLTNLEDFNIVTDGLEFNLLDEYEQYVEII